MELNDCGNYPKSTGNILNSIGDKSVKGSLKKWNTRNSNLEKKRLKFDVLDREEQIKILLSENKIIKFGIKDYLKKFKLSEGNSEIGPIGNKSDKEESIIVKGGKIYNQMTSGKNLNSNLNRNSYKESKSLNRSEKSKRSLSPLFYTRSKSFRDDTIFKHLIRNQLFSQSKRNYFNKRSRSKSFINEKYSLEVEPDGLKLKMPIEEKLILKQVLVSSEDVIIKKKEERRVLSKRQIVYDSCSDEEIEMEDEGNFVIYPKSFFKCIWDFLIFSLTIVTIFLSPLSMAFDMKEHSIFLIDIIFFADMVLCFFMGYYDNEENLILTQKKIILNYIFGWFLFDLSSCIPFNTLKNLDLLPLNIYYFCLLRILKFYKVQNSSNIFYMKIIKKMICNCGVKRLIHSNVSISAGAMRLGKNFLLFLILIHILSCVWIYLSKLSPRDNWTNKVNYNSKKDRMHLYLTSVYFNMYSVLTLGYGDIAPVSFIERFYSLFLLVIALGVNTYAVSFLGSISSLGSESNAMFENKKEFLDNIAIEYKINYQLYQKILNFLKYTYHFKADEKDKFINFLPTSLKNLLICNMYKDIIDNFNFFKMNRSDNIEFKSRVLLSLRPIVAYKGEDVIKIGEFVDEVVFVKSGQLSMFINYMDIRVRLLYLRRNENFGEILLLSNERSPIGLRVISSRRTELLLLRKADFLKILNGFTDSFTSILDHSKKNMKILRKIISQKKIQIRKMFTQTNIFEKTYALLKQKEKNFKNILEQVKRLGIYNEIREFNRNSTIINEVNRAREIINLNKENNKEKIEKKLIPNCNFNEKGKIKKQNELNNFNNKNQRAFNKVTIEYVDSNNHNNNSISRKNSYKINNDAFDSQREKDNYSDLDNSRPKTPESSIRVLIPRIIKNNTKNLSFGKINNDSLIKHNYTNMDERFMEKASMSIMDSLKKKIDLSNDVMKLSSKLDTIIMKYINYD